MITDTDVVIGSFYSEYHYHEVAHLYSSFIRLQMFLQLYLHATIYFSSILLLLSQILSLAATKLENEKLFFNEIIKSIKCFLLKKIFKSLSSQRDRELSGFDMKRSMKIISDSNFLSSSFKNCQCVTSLTSSRVIRGSINSLINHASNLKQKERRRKRSLPEENPANLMPHSNANKVRN